MRREGVPALIRIARTNPEDPRALDLFEEILR
jgi:hypothetical protein